MVWVKMSRFLTERAFWQKALKALLFEVKEECLIIYFKLVFNAFLRTESLQKVQFVGLLNNQIDIFSLRHQI